MRSICLKKSLTSVATLATKLAINATPHNATADQDTHEYLVHYRARGPVKPYNSSEVVRSCVFHIANRFFNLHKTLCGSIVLR